MKTANSVNGFTLQTVSKKNHRNTIYLEDAEVISHDSFAGEQYILRLHAPLCAEKARPGSFVHVTCGPDLPMRRPLSIMRVSGREGWIDLLYKIAGRGTAILAERKPGEKVSVLGPIGVPFQTNPERPVHLLMGGGVGIPPMLFLAEQLYREKHSPLPLVLMGSEIPFPFTTRPSAIMVPGVPAGTIAAMPLLEDWGIPSRLASLQGYPGCYEGYITDLARHWLDAQDEERRRKIEIFACGPTIMLQATAQLASEYGLACQVSLEEFMACGVGGCAGCTVSVDTLNGPAMKRVCVDGPVFDAYTVFS